MAGFVPVETKKGGKHRKDTLTGDTSPISAGSNKVGDYGVPGDTVVVFR